MSVGIKERLDTPEEQQRSATENQLANMRVAMPGIIISFDPDKQTASVQPAITENIQIEDKPTEAMELPILSDVPVCFPRAGGYCITFPVKKGDECLLVFADMCIDGWWQSGGVQDQMETRRHDLSDAFALIGVTSVPRAVKGYSSDSVMLRNEDGDTYVEIRNNKITITAAGDINIKSGGNMRLESAGTMTLKAPTINVN